MRKRCTESRCRRYFKVLKNCTCPYCGHIYPRLDSDSPDITRFLSQHRFDTREHQEVILISLPNDDNLATALRLIEDATKKSPAEVAKFVTPVIIASCSGKDAFDLGLALVSVGTSVEIKPKNKIGELPISTLRLSARTSSVLSRAKKHHISDILALTEDQLFSLRNMGRRSGEEILIKLERLGCHLK